VRAQMSGEVDLAALSGFGGPSGPGGADGAGGAGGVILQIRVAGTEAGLRKSLAALAASEPLAVVFAELASSIAYEVPHNADVALAWNEPVADHDDAAAGSATCFSAVRSCASPSPLERSGFTNSILIPDVALEHTVVIEVTDLPEPVRTVLAEASITTLWLHHIGVGEQLACIVVARTIPGPPWTTHDLALERASSVIGLALEQQRTEQLLRFAAQNDNLTGLANRATFFRAIAQILDAPDAGGFAVVYLDLDGFKPVNDTWGHPAGDAILREVAARLRIACRPTDVIARLGGDEFAVVCPGVGHADAANAIGQRIIDVMAPAFELRLETTIATASVGASVGVVYVPSGGSTLTSDELIDIADTELYAVKHAGGGAVRVRVAVS
jgi:diguanylate cyclase (GGDEF)-like protein